MTLPISMPYIAIREPGPPDVLVPADGPLPTLKSGEVLIKVAYAGVNRPDCLQRSGAYPPPADASPIVGLEVAGTVVAVSDGVTSVRVGDEVCALTPGGGYAGYCATPAGFCLPIPSGMTMREAAAIPENYFTVWYNLFDRIRVVAGETLLVHGGTSGIGLTAIQLGKAFGAMVIATAGSPQKVAFCRTMGADHAIDYKQQDFVAEVARITNKRGVDVVLDMVGGSYVDRNLKSMALEGRLSQIGFLEGNKVNIDMRHVMIKRLIVTGSTLRASPQARKVALAHALCEHVWPLFAQRKLRVVIQQEFPLAQAAHAHALMESGKLIGKVVLAV